MPLPLIFIPDVESALRMELVLNLAWVLLATVMVSLWLRCSPRAGADKRMQLVALAVLLLILFPVISVTDDLLAVQNPAETDSCQRRVHGYSVPHSTLASVASLPLPAFSELSFGDQRAAAPGTMPKLVFDDPALHPIENRPPPAA